MRLLPCSQCGSASLREGPYALPKWPGGGSHRYRCTCGRTNRVSREQWNTLPRMSPQEMVQRKVIRWDNLDLPHEQRAYLQKEAKFSLEDVALEAKDIQELARR